MKTYKLFTTLTATLLAAVFLAGTAFAAVGTVYLKNNGSYKAHVWIDAKYQGYVPAGETRYAVSDGFVTSSGSVGGWAATEGVQVVVACTDDKGNNWYSEANLPADAGIDGRVWFNGPLTLNDSDKENAGKILIYGGGNGPVDMLKDAQQAASDKRDDSSSPPATPNTDSSPTNSPPVQKVSWSPMQIDYAKNKKTEIPQEFVGLWGCNRTFSGYQGSVYFIIDTNGTLECFAEDLSNDRTRYSDSDALRVGFWGGFYGKPVSVSDDSVTWQLVSTVREEQHSLESLRALRVPTDSPHTLTLKYDSENKHLLTSPPSSDGNGSIYLQSWGSSDSNNIRSRFRPSAD